VKAIPQDWNDCAGKVFDFKPMSEVDVLWRFSGKNESLNQGRMDVFVMKYADLRLRHLIMGVMKYTDNLLRNFPLFFRDKKWGLLNEKQLFSFKS